MDRILLSGLAGVVLFPWGFSSDALLPLHDRVFQTVGGEPRVGGLAIAGLMGAATSPEGF